MGFADPEKQRAYNKAWGEQNRDKQRAANNRCYAKNRAEILATRKRARELNRDARNEKQRTDEATAIRFKRSGVVVPSETLVRRRGPCDICSVVPAPGKVHHVDHDHASNRVRGILCVHCNHGLGHFRDSPSALRRAAEYVERASRDDFGTGEPA